MSNHEGIWTEYRPTYADHWSACKRMGGLVRCRDCRWCVAYSKATYCDRFAHALPTIEPDGFCAWGERRDA